MMQAKREGFTLTLLFIGLDNPETYLDRVAQRVVRGGHGVPADDVRRRAERSMRNLPKALQLVDHAIIYDNSSLAGHRPVMTFEHGEKSVVVSDVPSWVTSSLAL